MSAGRRILILGIDGASWKIIDKMIEWGAMPYLKHLLSNGKIKRGPMHSTLPPMTPPAWTSIATGVNPGKHGVYGFHRIFKDKDGFRFHLMRPYDVGYPRIHEMLAMFKLKSIIINLPLTYPPWETLCKECTIINDWMAPELRIHPVHLEPKFKHYFTKGLEGHVLKSRSESSINAIADRAYTFAEGVLELMNTVDWDLLFVVFSEPDWIMHFNPDFVGGKKAGSELKVYSAIDDFLRKTYSIVDDIIMVSDHGFTVCNRLVNVPYFLKKYGLAEKTFQETLTIKFSNIEVPSWIIRFLRKHDKIKKIALSLASKLTRKATRTISIESTTHTILYNEAKAIMPDAGIIYAAPNHEKDVLSVLERIPGIQSVLVGKEVYWGYNALKAPDYVLIPEEPYCIYTKSDTPFMDYNTNHHPIGLLGLGGDHVDEVWWRSSWNTWDVVPLALTLLKLPVPADTDGYYPGNIKRYNYYSRWNIAVRTRDIKRSH